MKRLGILLGTLVVAALAWVSSAMADSATITATDAGGGLMHVVAEVTSTECSSYGYCGWFSFAVERHSSLPCVEDEAFLMDVGDRQETSGTVRKEWTYEPFFPRSDKICVFVDDGPGIHAVGEAVISLPTGYGRQYSTAHNCSYFSSQRRAEYYLELYPSDPSRLDADHDGAACESNPCPCGAEAIPAEPLPAPVATPAPATTPTRSPTECAEGEAAVARAWARVLRYRHRWQRARGTRQARNRRFEWHRAQREARQTEEQQNHLCG
jgi:hypothetical protein